MKTDWKYAKNLKEMPTGQGRYLFMTEVGTIFVGLWCPHERRLYVQCVKFDEDGDGVRSTNGEIYMARWDFRRSGRVYWAKPGVDMDFYGIWRKCRSSERKKKGKA